MVANANGVDTIANKLTEINVSLLGTGLPVPSASGPKHLLDGFGQSVHVAQHQPVELLFSGFGEVATLQGLQMEANRSDGRLQLMSYSIDEAVVLFTAPDLAHEENRVHHHAGDDQGEEDDSEEQQDAFAPIEDDPANVESNGQRHQAYTQDDEERDRSTAARDAHGLFGLILPLCQNRRIHPKSKAPTEAGAMNQAFSD